MSKASALYVLHEAASGYALFDVVELDEVASLTPELQAAIADADAFKRICKLKAFIAFNSAEQALENINAIAEHSVPDRLKSFLETNLPPVSSKKKKKGPAFSLGVVEPDLGKAIAEATGAHCRSDDVVRELLRGATQHLTKFVPELQNNLLEQAQLGLGHAFSRCKVKFNPARADNMIIQAIGLLDTLDKDVNTFSMRVKEWYSWHFPELKDLVRENYAFARAACVVGDRASFLEAVDNGDSAKDDLASAVRDPSDASDDGVQLADSIVKAARQSMGMDCSAGDMANVMAFTKRMVALATYRADLSKYLGEKMQAVAPNLSTLVGDSVGARLIAKAGSLASLAKCPASTVQILGAEKALFRALKKKGNTPKYGLIYHSTFIGRAAKKNKGRVSRYLANKCAMASRIDAFADELTDKYGVSMREQVEERLKFFDSGETPRRNVDVMQEVAALLRAERGEDVEMADAPSSSKKEKKKKKRKEATRGRRRVDQSQEEEEEEVRGVVGP